jgi:hypothetical protein
MSETPKDVVKPRAAAAELDTTEVTLCRWRKQGRGPDFIQDGRYVRYTREALENFKRGETRGNRNGVRG